MSPKHRKIKKTAPKHIIIKLLKINSKEKTGDKIHTDTLYREEQLKIIADFLPEIIQARRTWNNIFRVVRGKKM